MRIVNFIFYAFLGLCLFACKKDNEETPQEVLFSLQEVTVSATRVAGIKTDGVSDKTEELQKLLNDYGRQRRAIRLSEGKYIISSDLIIPSNTSLEGTNDATEIVLMAGSASGKSALQIPEGSTNITIKNIKISVNQTANTGSDINALTIAGKVSNLFCTNVVFTGGKDKAVIQVEGSTGNESSNLRFISCSFPQAGSSTINLKGTKNCVISASAFESWGTLEPSSPAILLNNCENSRLEISNNTFNNTNGKQYGIESSGVKVVDSKITGNKLNDTKNLGGNGIYGFFSKSVVSSNILAGSDGTQKSTVTLLGEGNTTQGNTFTAPIPTAEPVAPTVPAAPITTAPAEASPAPVTPAAPAPAAPAPAEPSTTLPVMSDYRTYLQNLIKTHASQGKVLRLPAGKFVISDVITLPSNTNIEGAGDATEIILTGGTAVGRNVFKIIKGTSNIRLAKLKINANQSQNTGADLVALYLTEGISNLNFEYVNFAGGRDRGTVQIKGLDAAQVTNIRFFSCNFSETGRTSLELRGTANVTINKCVFTNWGSQNPNSPAIQLQSQANHNVQITENTFNNTMGTQFAIECAAAYVVNSKISNNKLNDPKNLGGNGISGYYKNTEVSNNVLTGGNGNQRSGLEIFGVNNSILNNTIAAGNIAIAHGLGEQGSNILIKNNNVKTKGVNAAGILMGNGKYDLHNITVINNIVDTRAATGNSSGIVVGTYGSRRAINNVTVENNTIWSNAFCIRLESLPGSKDIYLTKNTCKAGMSWLGIITNTFSNIVAKGNIKEMSNKGIIYSVTMPKVADL